MKLYTINLNIKGLDNRLIEAMKNVGKSNEFDIVLDKEDCLIFESDRGLNFTKLINELSNVCTIYSVDYFDLLV